MEGTNLPPVLRSKPPHLPDFRRALTEIAAAQLGDRVSLRPTLHIDAVVKLDELSWSVAQQFARLEPTGQDNTPPVLMARGCRVRGVRTVGNGKHLKLSLESQPVSLVWEAVGFYHGAWKEKLNEGSLVDIAFQLEVNEWQGRRTLQLNLQDLRVGRRRNLVHTRGARGFSRPHAAWAYPPSCRQR